MTNRPRLTADDLEEPEAMTDTTTQLEQDLEAVRDLQARLAYYVQTLEQALPALDRLGRAGGDLVGDIAFPESILADSLAGMVYAAGDVDRWRYWTYRNEGQDEDVLKKVVACEDEPVEVFDSYRRGKAKAVA